MVVVVIFLKIHHMLKSLFLFCTLHKYILVSKQQYSGLLEGYKAAAAAAREDAEAARRDAENSRLEAKRREESVLRQEATIAGKVAGISRENEELKEELYRMSQQLQQLQSNQQSNQQAGDDLSDSKRKISSMEVTCKQLEEALDQERLNHKEYVMSTHKKIEKICEERASADAKARSFEVRLNEMSRQCEQLAHEKDVALSAAKKNSPTKVYTYIVFSLKISLSCQLYCAALFNFLFL